MKSFIVSSICLLFIFNYSFAQVREFDQLEMRYDQNHYRSVYRKAQKLAQDSAFNYALLPEYYVALSSLQLAQNKYWLKRHKNALADAKKTFTKIKKSPEGKRLLEAHLYELSILKNDLSQWMYLLKQEQQTKTFEAVEEIVNTIFDKVPSAEYMVEDKIAPPEIPIETEELVDETSSPTIDTAEKVNKVDNLLDVANDYLGVPYKWGGTTPKGFDCSGYSSYVFKESAKKILPRTAAAQYHQAEKVKLKNVVPGDLVFFGSRSRISYVGIVYATEDNSVQMIHSSTSIGISIVDIYTSSYWKKRIVGFGRIALESNP